MADIKDATDAELDGFARVISAEQERRRVLATAPGSMDQLVRDLLAAQGIKEGDEWEQPTGYENAYPKEWVVAHDGKEWTSNLGGNTGEPGVSGWTQIVAEGDAPPEWVDPPGYQDAYKIGDRVTFEGAVYESVIDGNTWSPTDYPAGWEKE